MLVVRPGRVNGGAPPAWLDCWRFVRSARDLHPKPLPGRESAKTSPSLRTQFSEAGVSLLDAEGVPHLLGNPELPLLAESYRP
jgi:hypothetical protein